MATQKQQNKVSKVMREFYSGKLTTHGNKVTDPSQAKAIALSEAGVSKKKKKGAKKAKRKYAKGGMVESEINELYKKSKFINDDFNWKLKLMEMIQDRSIEAYNIYQSLTKEQKEEVLQEQFEVDNDMGSDGDGDIETTKENLSILLEDAKNGKKYAKGGSTGNIPKSLMDKINEINSLIKWAEDKDNFVGGYFGGTYYEYLDFEKPIETKNQFVYIEYNHGGGRKSSDRYNVNKKGQFDSNGLAELKSELSRILSAFRRAKKKYEQYGYFGEGGDVEKQNKEMVHSQVKEAKHHSEELSDILKEDKEIEAWVIAKMERATTDLSDVTHYLDGKDKSFVKGGGVDKVKIGDSIYKVFFTDSDGDEHSTPIYAQSEEDAINKFDLFANSNISTIDYARKINTTSEYYIFEEMREYADGGGVGENEIDFKNFTIAEFNSFVKSINAYGDISVSVSVGNNVNKEGTYTKKIDIKKLKDLSMSLGDGKEISVITGSENIYADVLVYDNNYDKGYKEYTISLFSKDDKKGLKSIVNAIIEKFKNGGGVGDEKPLSYYKYSTPRVNMAWNGKIQQGSFYSAEEAMEAIKKQAQTEEELTHYSIVTPDKVIHLGKEYAIRYANGGGVEDELYVAEYQKGQWTVKDKKNPSANYTLSSKKENAENVRQALIDSPSKLKYYRNNEYAKGGGVEGDCGCNGGDEYGTGGGVDHECKCDEGGVYNNPFLKSIFGI